MYLKKSNWRAKVLNVFDKNEEILCDFTEINH